MVNMSNYKSSRVRAGMYRITVADRSFHVEQIRTDTPGYGVENRWWISAADDGPELFLDPEATKADAIDAVVATITRPMGRGAAAVDAADKANRERNRALAAT